MQRTKRIVIAAVVTMLLSACAYQSVLFNPQPDRHRKLVVVQTTHGQVAGFQAENGLNMFLGIPYAQPPVGNLRFSPPQPVAKWKHVRPAYRFGPTCPQPLDEFEPSSLLYQDEDCLSLNIWTPGIDAKKRPVLIYIHGGGFVAGGTADPLYNGEHLSKRGGIVVASINYRVGALGFLYLDDLDPRFAGSGNIALMDQIAGLTWVKKNIARFGGDPDNITIMGESAGSTSVMFHMISPKSKGLFKKAIAESGAVNLSRTKEQAAKYTKRFMELAGVKDVHGLRALSASKLIEIEEKFIDEAGFESDIIFSPVRDGINIPADPYKAFTVGAAAGISFLNGTTQDEFRYWLLYYPSLKYIPSSWVLSSSPAAREKLGTSMDTLINYYRKTLPDAGISGVTFALVSEMMFRIPHIRVSDLQSKHAPVWMYRFDWDSHVSDDLGSCHAIELPFVLRTFDSPTHHQIVGTEYPLELSDTMMDAWISFIKTGNPNHDGVPKWPVYDTRRRATMIFNDTSGVQDDPDKASRLLYEEINP